MESDRKTRAHRKMKQPRFDSDDHKKVEQEVDADVDDSDDEDQESASPVAIRGKLQHANKRTPPVNLKASRGTEKHIHIPRRKKRTGKSPSSDSQSGDS